jgi:hypothetical protein
MLSGPRVISSGPALQSHFHPLKVFAMAFRSPDTVDPVWDAFYADFTNQRAERMLSLSHRFCTY